MSEALNYKNIAHGDMKILNAKELHGDVHFHNDESRPDFQKISLDDMGSYLAPSSAHEALEKLKSESLIIIGGNPDFDQFSFSKYLASCLIKDWPREFVVKERLYESQAYSIFPVLKKEKVKDEKGQIFIFNETSPQEFKFDVDRLHKLLRQSGNVAILCSKMHKEAWKLSEMDQRFWFRIELDLSYDFKGLLSHLIEKMNSNEYPWGNWVKEKNWKAEDLFINSVPVRALTEELKNPEEVALFSRYLSAEFIEEPPNLSQVHSLIKRSRKGREGNRLLQWFSALQDKQQLIVICAHLFEGCYDDQFFSILKLLLAKHWTAHKNSLEGLDYEDLEFAHDFIKLTPAGNEEYIINHRYANQRYDLLQIIWGTHRRRILEVMDFMIDLVVKSVQSKTSNWEIYGSRKKRRSLRNSISETLSDIGRISQKMIDVYLLRLAANRHSGVNTVAAKAMGRWREFDEIQHLYAFLDRWEQSMDVRNMVKYIREQQGAELDDAEFTSHIEYIQSSIAIVVGYAAYYDQPNQMPDRLHDTFKRLIGDRKAQVRRSLRSYTIPLLIQYHASQLYQAGTMDLILNHADLYASVAKGLVRAYEDFPDLVKGILDDWRKYCLENTSGKLNKLNIRDVKMLALIETYRNLPYQATESEVIGLNVTYDLLGDLRKQEHQPQIRRLLVETILDLIEKNLHHAKLNPEKLLIHIDQNERDIIIAKLGEKFQNQRWNLIGGDYEIKLQNQWYSLWIDSERPKTLVEDLVREWMLSKSTGVIQLATLVNGSYVTQSKKRDQEFKDRILKDREELEAVEAEERLLLPASSQEMTKVDAKFSTKLQLGTAALLFRLTKREKEFLKGVLPVTIQENTYTEEEVKAMIKEWKEEYKDSGNDLNFRQIEKAVNLIFFGKKLVKS